MKNMEFAPHFLFEKLQTGIVCLDPDGRIMNANPAAEEILGIPKKELVSAWLVETIREPVRQNGDPFPGEAFPGILALKTGEVQRNVIMGMLNPRSRKRIWIKLDSAPFFEEDGKTVAGAISNLTDISDKIEIQAQFMETERKFQALFNKSPIGIAYHKMLYDEEGKPVDYAFLDANEHYIALTGVDPRGKTLKEAFPDIKNDTFDWVSKFGKVALDGITMRIQQHVEPLGKWYDLVGFQSNPDHFVAAFIDISEQKNKELELERLKNELEDKVRERTREIEIEKEKAEAANRAKTSFLANVSHELRTPLNAVLGYTDILLAKENDPLRSKYLNSISTSGRTLLSLIDDVLDLSKIEAEKYELEYSAVSLRNLFKDIDVIFARKILDKGLTWSMEISDDVPGYLVLDEARIRQILLNLVSNAFKFTESGGISLHCKPYTRRESGTGEVHLEITIRDTGKGIEPGDRERIFESFSQAAAQKVSEYGGTGLGLAISKKLAQLMQGELKVESTPGKGSEFTLFLYDVELARPEEKAGQKHLTDPDSVIFKPAHVLIVDDIDYNREITAVFLQAHDLELSFAVNGKQALEMIWKKRPDLVLLDMKMPVMSGYELSTILKKSEKYRDIPIIAVTASSLSSEEIEIAKTCEGFLRKPISRAEIISSMTDFLEHEIISGEKLEETKQAISFGPDDLEGPIFHKLHDLILDGDMDGIVRFLARHESSGSREKMMVQHIIDLARECNEVQLMNLMGISP